MDEIICLRPVRTAPALPPPPFGAQEQRIRRTGRVEKSCSGVTSEKVWTSKSILYRPPVLLYIALVIIHTK
jgi:hypothetical protein